MTEQDKLNTWTEWKARHIQDALAFYAAVPGIDANHGAQWHANRACTITGTDMASILGANKYGTALDVFNCKTLRTAPDMTPRIRLAAGSALEPVCTQFAASQLDGAVLPYGANPSSQIFAQSTARPWSRSQIDNVIAVPGLGFGVVECKTSSHPARVGYGSPCVIADGHIIEPSAEAPVYYLLQAHKEMCDAHEDRTWADKPAFALIVLLSDFGELPSIYYVPYDPAIHEQIKLYADRFMFENVIADTEPEAAPAELIERFKAMPSKADYAENEGAAAIASKINRLTAEQKALDAQLEEAKQELCLMIGEHEGVKTGGKVVATWKSRARFDEKEFKKDKPELWEAYQKSSFDSTKFKAENAVLYKNYMKTGSTRVLNIKYKD